MATSTTPSSKRWPQLLDLPYLTDGRPLSQAGYHYAPLQLDVGRLKDFFSHSKRLAVYVHIPFCRELCSFCNCNVIVTKQYSLASQYIDTLRKEIDWYGQALARNPATQTPLMQLYVGGGTPTYLMHDDFRRLHHALSNNFRLTNAPHRDYSIEVDPRSFDDDTAEQIVELGFNRIHFGLEDFSADVQHAINRKYSVQKIEQTFHSAREAGLSNISIDLVYGLPNQTVASFKSTLNQIARLQPTQVIMRLFQTGTNAYNTKNDSKALPSKQAISEIQSFALAYWTAKGYSPLGSQGYIQASDTLFNAADKGEIFLAPRGYTRHRHDSELGFGLATSSNAGNYRWQNQPSLRGYTKQILKSGNAAYQGILLTRDDQMRREIANNLLCNQPLDKGAFERKWHCNFNHYFNAEIKKLTAMGTEMLINNNDSNFYLQPEGRCYAHYFASTFLSGAHAS